MDMGKLYVQRYSNFLSIKIYLKKGNFECQVNT